MHVTRLFFAYNTYNIYSTYRAGKPASFYGCLFPQLERLKTTERTTEKPPRAAPPEPEPAGLR